MAFTITELESLGSDSCNARVIHRAESFLVSIPEPLSRVKELGADFQAELNFKNITKHEIGLVKDDSSSGLFQTDNPSVVIVDGSIFNLLELEDDVVVADIYIQNGPEFIAVTSSDLGGTVPALNTRIRLWIKGLQVYPTFA